MVWILSSSSENDALVWLWLVAMYVAVLVRSLIAWKYFRLQDKGSADNKYWHRRFVVGLSFTSVVWGSASLLLFTNELSDQVFLAFVIAGMVAGGLASLSASIVAYRWYVALCLTPLFSQFLFVGSPTAIAMAAMTLAFGAVVLSNGRQIYFRFVENISLRYEALEREQQLIASKQDLINIFNGVNEGILVIDLEGRLMQANPRALSLLGIDEAELLNDSVSKLLTAKIDDKMVLPMYWHRVVTKHESVTFNWMLKHHKTGELLDIELSLQRMRLGQGDVVLANVHDISESKKIERMKNEFVSTVSHELRTPLTAIRGALGLLQGKVVLADADKERLTEVADRNAQRLSMLINDILDVEKMASGKMSMSLADHFLVELLEQSLEANQGYATNYNVEMQLQNAVPTALKVRVDPGRFLQVMANLLSNAIKFSPPQGCVLVQTELNDARVKISVIDNGPGIPLEFQSKIFGKFAQADTSATRGRGGTGLGLNISQGIVQRLGGEIGFTSQPGQGACFYFYLPVLQG
ncbi:MAG: ATP-binding protein [Gammaproteobacteria bacterium]|nr:ATP-binding protein [Gammaproteobacteria bacterium]